MRKRIIVQYWNEASLPSDIAGLSSSWAELNKDDGFEHIVYSRDTATDFIRSAYGADTAELFLSARIPAMQSDIFRVAYCLAEGGLYVDIGSKCKQAITPLFDMPTKLVLMRKWHGNICNGLIISDPGNPVLSHIWELVLGNVSGRKSASVWSVTGPENYIKASEQPEFSSGFMTVDQLGVTDYFELVGNEKRKGEEHWSNLEKTVDLYFSLEAPDQNSNSFATQKQA